MGELHPSSSAKTGNIPTDAITKGIHADLGPFKAAQEVWCRQCGQRCNLGRDVRGVEEFSGATISKGFEITDHDYDGAGEDHDYDGSGRTTTDLSEELSNGSFEDWTAGDPDNWTVSGSVAQETTAGYYDPEEFHVGANSASSAKFVRSGSEISLSQAASTPSDFNSNAVTFRARVKSITNGVIRLKVTINSTDYYSHYNVAQQNFQELLIVATCPSSVSSLTVYIMADSANGTAYVDNAILSRSGNPSTASVGSGCPHCGSFDYFTTVKPL